MRTEILEESKKEDWNSFVYSHANTISWHLFEWHNILQSHYRLRFYPIAAYDGSRIAGILPLYEIDRIRTGKILISIPYFVAGGIVADDEEAERALLAKAIELTHKTGARRMLLKQYRVKVNGELCTESGYYNRELTLSRDLSWVWEQIMDQNRKKIQEARTLDLTLEYPSANLTSFYQMLLTYNHGQGIPCVGKRWVAALLATRTYEIALFKLRGRTVAATLVKKFRDTFSLPLTCLPDDTASSHLFAYALYWELIQHLAADGFRIFHSGRIPEGELVPAFRLGWGGTRYDYWYQCFEPGNKTRSLVSKRQDPSRRLFQKIWRRLPVGIARFVGPLIVAQFP